MDISIGSCYCSRQNVRYPVLAASPLRPTVSPLTVPHQIEVHVFYVALGYLISYLPCVLVMKALSSVISPWVDPLVGGLMLLPALDDRCHTAAQFEVAQTQRAEQKLLLERFL
jgi:hypothetical protein